MHEMPEHVVAAVDRMPAFPKSVQQVLTLAAEPNCSPRDLVDVLKNDPIFTLKILKVVNSPFMGLANRITSIHQACVYLGVNTLKNLALSLASVGMLPGSNRAGFDMNHFWLHSLAVALSSRRLALMLRVSQQESSDYFSAGLLHDIGKAVLALTMPEEFRRSLAKAREESQPLFEVERDELEVNHADVGALLAQRWGFPESLLMGIAMHHEAGALDAPLFDDAADVVTCVFVADQICKTLRYGDSGEAYIQPLPPWVEQRFDRDLPDLIRSLPDMEEELQKARVFISA